MLEPVVMFISDCEVNMNYNYFVEPGEYLVHHGVKGQKWGIRRYQNKDGSLTPEGRERFRKNINKLISDSDFDGRYTYGNRDKIVNKNPFLKNVKRKTQKENANLLQEAAVNTRKLKSMMESAKNKGYDHLMNLLSTPEYVDAFNKWSRALIDYNKAQKTNINTLLGDMGDKKIPGQDITYKEYVEDLLYYENYVEVEL